MKYPTKYRYVAWDEDGSGWSYGQPPCIPHDPDPFEWYLPYTGGRKQEPTLNHMCSGEWNERYYDMEDENDRLLLESLICL